jgi:hypothetical protein
MTIRVMHMLHDLEIAAGDWGSTVRKGFKWADVQNGDTLRLCVCSDRCAEPDSCGVHIYDGEPRSCENCTVKGRGTVDRVWVGFFRDVPAYFLSFEHERRSREYWGLFDSMRKAYGTGFSEQDLVTVVVYRREA